MPLLPARELERRIIMEFIADILLFGVGWLIGSLLFTWSTLQIIISFRCAFPLLKIISDLEHIFDIKACKALFRKTVVINYIVFAVVVALVILFAPHMMQIGFVISYIFTFILSLGKTGMNNDNLMDFTRILFKKVKIEDIDFATEEFVKKLQGIK